MQRYYLLLLLLLICSSPIEGKTKLTLDDFFDATDFPYVRLSPTGEHLLVQTSRAKWDTNSYENSLWVYHVQSKTKRLITQRLLANFQPSWSPSGESVAFSQSADLAISATKGTDDRSAGEYIYLYSIVSERLTPVLVGEKTAFSVTWSASDSSLYFVTAGTGLADVIDGEDWRDVIQYRKPNSNDYSTIYRVDLDSIESVNSAKTKVVENLPFQIATLLYAPFEEQLIFSSASATEERLEDFEIYSISTRNTSAITRLTNNSRPEEKLKLSRDGKHLLFIMFGDSSQRDNHAMNQERLFSLDLSTRTVTRMAKDFDGSIMGYEPKSDGGLYVLGLLGTEIQIYSQQSPEEKLIHHRGQNGTYELLTGAASSCSVDQMAFVHSSFQRPKEVYFVDSIDQLEQESAITHENQQLTERDLPQAEVYRWNNSADQQAVEGILHYPPGQFREKNLPLLVLIHGGPNSASVNALRARWHAWAALAATEGWLVFEPNYRGSTGYGDKFLNDISQSPLTRPGNDILSGVDCLIRDGIVDSKKMAVGGYSYGGHLTNWLITQTTRFKAALSGAGATEHVSAWATFDTPTFTQYLFGGYPWETGELYQNESAIYQLGKVTTPTMIVTGDADTRVTPDQSYMLERGLHYLGVPVQLLVFPNEGHGLTRNPWHGKIKVREELKWLQKYGQQQTMRMRGEGQIKTSKETMRMLQNEIKDSRERTIEW